ncbi:hypothetical protein NQ315_004092 [Exocentrus adspersus]|uniref:Membrane insertase YidC/Oxa/ALB C-terminal domain-containing protein n=1 Tax=Exocentrus adspersus TaxID=1586481 RepID=A0AAV8W6D1_9CUCU|nr:hypothetical protein NQ315_004092 [Exocentrus adspersus]
MLRYFSFAKYKGCRNALKNVKDVNATIPKEIKNFLKEVQCNHSDLLNKLKINISNAGIKLQESGKILSSVQNTLEERKSVYKSKHLRSRYIKREAEKLCDNLQKRDHDKANVAENAAAATVTQSVDSIPEPPPVPDIAQEIVNQVNALGEPTFASLGLGGYSPVGLAQMCFEYVHVTLGTLIIRILLFPLVVIAQRNAARMNNYLPQMQALQLKMTEARQTGNQIDAARYSQELMVFMKEKNLNPLKNMIVPLVQAPVFVSFFMALRQMCNAPVESLTTGGLWWFTDLTLPDQYFLMPIITSATLYATIELGTDSAKLSSQNMQLMKYVLRGMPLVILPFTINFPGAILVYWVSTNFISLIQVGILRIPTVRDYFNIEPMQKFNPENLPIKPKGFREGLRDSWTNIKISKELEDRRRLDEMQFQRAGRGPIVKTYKYDPTKQTEPMKSAPISAKKRE